MKTRARAGPVLWTLSVILLAVPYAPAMAKSIPLAKGQSQCDLLEKTIPPLFFNKFPPPGLPSLEINGRKIQIEPMADPNRVVLYITDVNDEASWLRPHWSLYVEDLNGRTSSEELQYVSPRLSSSPTRLSAQTIQDPLSDSSNVFVMASIFDPLGELHVTAGESEIEKLLMRKMRESPIVNHSTRFGDVRASHVILHHEDYFIISGDVAPSKCYGADSNDECGSHVYMSEIFQFISIHKLKPLCANISRREPR